MNNVAITSDQFGPVQTWYSLLWSWAWKGRVLSPKIQEIHFPKSLHVLNIAKCNLSPDAFSKVDLGIMSLLNWLDLGGNPINSLPDSIKNLTRLKTLNIAYCTKIKCLEGLPSNITDLNADGCLALEKVASCAKGHPVEGYLNCINLVEVEGVFKLEPLENADAQVLAKMGISNLEHMKSIMISLVFGRAYNAGRVRNEYPGFVQDDISSSFSLSPKEFPPQILYHRAVFSTFLPGESIPTWFSYKFTDAADVYCTLQNVDSHKVINGLSICFVYKCPEAYTNVGLYDGPAIWLRNPKRDLNWALYPAWFGLPKDNESGMMWFSYWKVENLFQQGDVIEVMGSPQFAEFKELGVKIFYLDEQTENSDGTERIQGISLDMPMLMEDKSAKRFVTFLRFLRILNLSHSRELTRTPDFAGMPRLEKLFLKDCVKLVDIDESIGYLQEIALLNLKDCKSIRKLPRDIGKLKSLKTLDISFCSSLEWLPMELNMIKSLKVLRADGICLNQMLCTANEWKPLKALFSSWISKQRISSEISWAFLPSSLVSLSLVSCRLSDGSFPKKFSNLPLLEELDLSENLISCLPEWVKSLPQLQSLSVKSCKMLKSLTEMPNSISELSIDSCSSLEMMTYQSLKSKYPNLGHDYNCDSLVMMQGNFKLEALENADPQMLKRFGLNLETMENAMVKMDLFSSYKMKMLPPQGLYEQGIFSTFLPGNKVPSWFTKLENMNAVSFTISQPLNNIQGLSIAVVYTSSESQQNEFSRAYWRKQQNIVHNTTKDLKWMHNPRVFGVPEGNEEITWLSHWKFGDLLQDGDGISILVRLNNLKVKELGIDIVCDERELSDLSNCEVASQLPMFSNDNVPGDVSKRGILLVNQDCKFKKKIILKNLFDQLLRFLRILNLSHSWELTRTPSFSGMPPLEKLILKDCVELVEIDESICCLPEIALLNLKDCKNIRKLPRNVAKLKSLKTLDISFCSSLECLPMGLRMIDSLEVLRADGIGLNQILCTTECKSLQALFSSWISKPRISPEISWAFLPSSLVSLSLVSCSLSDESFSKKFSGPPLLQNLDLSGNSISCLPEWVKSLPQLRNLSVQSCKTLKSLTEIPSCISELSIQALENAGVRILERFGLNVERMENAMVKMNCFAGSDDKMLPLQGLYEDGVFSTFLPGNRIPSLFFSGKNTNGISFIIPEPLNNVRGLSIAVVYICSEHQNYSRAYWQKQQNIVHNRTKDLKWIHSPNIFGMPEGTEEMTWLSHWEFGNLLEVGDEISILVSLSRLKVKGIWS
ncbi:hypothetical protein RND71_000601 [Anisodus tanguticus]|uniref:Uncharacterized protein n=1 Tax=Anisodus tanguticus TaxID=243964 RepID=A0AAE1SZA7_9SOLA|nr:hypothetical protein RND71_000601 [Anisodus tanguticus]